MTIAPIQANSGLASVSYCERMSWVVRKEDWDEVDQRNKVFGLRLNSAIPGTCNEGHRLPPGWQDKIYEGGRFFIGKYGIVFVTWWPKDVDLDRICIQAEFKLKTTDGKCIIDIKAGQRVLVGGNVDCDDCNALGFGRLVTINADMLYDEEGSFLVEANLVVEMKPKEADDPSLKVSNLYREEMKSILNDEKSSDVIVTVEDKEFKCHKAVLSARSVVFKNTFAHNTVESATNTIVIKESPAQAVEDMLKYIYSGDVPDDSKSLTFELLHIASMYQLSPIVEACLKNFVEMLDVASCISTFKLVDRYAPQDLNLREKVIMFMKCKAVEVVDEEVWDKLMEKSPDLVKEIVKALARAAKEKHKCEFCVVTYD